MAAYDPVSISSWPHCLFSYFIIFKSFKYFFLSITEQVLQMPTLEPLKWLSLSFEPLPLRYSHALSLILFLCSIVTLVNMVLAILLKPPPLVIPFSVAIMVDLLLAKIFHSPFSHLGVKIVFPIPWPFFLFRLTWYVQNCQFTTCLALIYCTSDIAIWRACPSPVD